MRQNISRRPAWQPQPTQSQREYWWHQSHSCRRPSERRLSSKHTVSVGYTNSCFKTRNCIVT